MSSVGIMVVKGFIIGLCIYMLMPLSGIQRWQVLSMVAVGYYTLKYLIGVSKDSAVLSPKT